MNESEEERADAVNVARRIMAVFFGGDKIVFPKRKPRVNRCEAKQRARFAHIPPRSARRESLRKFRRRLWGHKSLSYITARGRRGRQLKRSILRGWWHDEKRKRARQRAGKV